MPRENKYLRLAAVQDHLAVLDGERRHRDAHLVTHRGDVAHDLHVRAAEYLTVRGVNLQHALGRERLLHGLCLVHKYYVVDRELELLHNVGFKVADHEVRSQSVLEFSVSSSFFPNKCVR